MQQNRIKQNIDLNRLAAKLDDRHKEYVTNFFDQNSRATIVDAVDDLTNSFEGLDIKKSRVAESMKEECKIQMKESLVNLLREIALSSLKDMLSG